MYESERSQILAVEHLRLLRLGYLLEGGLSIAFAFFPLIYVLMGSLMAAGVLATGTPGTKTKEELWVGVGIAAVGVVVSLVFVVMGILRLLVARALRERRSRTLCQVVAAFTCFSMPYGTMLGIFTFMVLGRPEVVAMFRTQPPADAPPA